MLKRVTDNELRPFCTCFQGEVRANFDAKVEYEKLGKRKEN